MNSDLAARRGGIEQLSLDHIGIVTTDLAASIRLHCDGLGMVVLHDEVLARPGLRAVLMGLATVRIELLSPIRSETPVSRFLDRRGPGIHHLAYAVPRIHEELPRLTHLGLEPLSAEPEIGLNGTLTIFFHPRSTDGVLIELVQRSPSDGANEHSHFVATAETGGSRE